MASRNRITGRTVPPVSCPTTAELDDATIAYAKAVTRSVVNGMRPAPALDREVEAARDCVLKLTHLRLISWAYTAKNKEYR